jgi:hypothetical protein
MSPRDDPPRFVLDRADDVSFTIKASRDDWYALCQTLGRVDNAGFGPPEQHHLAQCLDAIFIKGAL